MTIISSSTNVVDEKNLVYRIRLTSKKEYLHFSMRPVLLGKRTTYHYGRDSIIKMLLKRFARSKLMKTVNWLINEKKIEK
ncbi:hypothetical protein T4B_209 [Trichinella pseudospiralis]|uniref:Uncharacterized protein n=1 Tax=Trichinella pseudospiralis TaxID=6337 RepID=A0A0V1ID99_TRIPS|nr:hypothetical protein T4B_209 [Trichinella pseudospiralis]